jgi:hypothetical protein
MPRVRPGPLLSLLLLAGLAPGCGAHFHRPQDAAASEQATGELKGARLTDGFGPELEQAGKMLAEELEVARRWAQQGRDRDLLDVLAAKAEDESDPDTEILLHPGCQGRFKGDGWPTLCSKLGRRIGELGGLKLPLPASAAEAARPAAGRARKDLPARAPAGPDAITSLMIELRGQLRAWRGPGSDEARLAKSGTDFVTQARTAGLSPGTAPAPRCPGPPLSATVREVPAVAAEAERARSLCVDRRRNLERLQRALCAGVEGCTGGRLGAQVAGAIVVHDTLAAHDVELARRVDAYVAARRPCEQHSGSSWPSGQVSTAAPGPSAPATCDARQVQRAFAALAEIPVPAQLEARGYGALARQGRALQLGEQLAALDRLIEERQERVARRPITTATNVPAGASVSPALAEALHATIDGISEVERVVDAFELSVLTLIRETLRVESGALQTMIGHAERRRRIELAKLTAQLEEYVLLLAAFVDFQRLDRAGCSQRPILEAQASEGCRDELSRLLLAHSNAWTLGRAAQAQADVQDLGVLHEASIDRSRAAMAVREVYLIAGVAELLRFNQGGLKPEALAQLIVSAVGFGVVAGGVY